jgi:hypothetical protein
MHSPAPTDPSPKCYYNVSGLQFWPPLHATNICYKLLPVHWGLARCILLAVSLIHHPLFPFATLIIHTYTVYCFFLCGYYVWTAWPWRGRHCHPLKHQKLFTQWHSVTSQKTWSNMLVEQSRHLCQHRSTVSRYFLVCVCVHFKFLVQTVSSSSDLLFQYEIFPFNQDIAVPFLTHYFISPEISFLNLNDQK